MGELENISIKQLMEVFLTNIKFIVAVTMAFAVGAFIYSETMIVPMYNATVTMYVNNTASNIQIEDKMLGSDITASQMLVPTCINIIKSSRMMTKVANEDEYNFSATKLSGMVSTSDIENTEIFKITVTYSDPEVAANIANTFAEVAPSVISEIIDASSVRVIDWAQPSNRKVSPNITKNTIFGFLLGLLLSCSFIFIRELFDVRIKNEADLEGSFEYPILGIIPRIGKENSGQESYYYRNSYYMRRKGEYYEKYNQNGSKSE